MATIKIGIVEDEAIIAENLRQLLTERGYRAAPPANSYTQALQLLEEEKPDLVLLDIHLSGRKDGFDVAQKITELYHIPFIFLTAFSDSRSLARAKAVHPHAYLVKPFKKDDLYAAIEIALHNHSTHLRLQDNGAAARQTNAGIQNRDYLFIKEKDLFYKIKASQIRFLKSEHIYVTVATQDHEYLVRSSLTDYLSKLDPTSFLRTHRSYAVNIDYITSVNTHHIVLGDTEIPIGKEFRDPLMQQLGL